MSGAGGGVVGAEHPQHVCQDSLVCADGLLHAPRQLVGEVPELSLQADSRPGLVVDHLDRGERALAVRDQEVAVERPPVRGDLKRDVVLVSAVEKFRVWDQEAWNKVFSDAEEKFTQNPESFGNLGF